MSEGKFGFGMPASYSIMSEDDAKKVRERAVKLHSEAYSAIATYDNVVIISGYAAFFVLWGKTADDIGHVPRLITVALMGISLMLYISWHMIQMFTRQRFDTLRAATFRYQSNPAKFDSEWDDVEYRRGIALQRTMRFWPSIFVPSVAFGFASAMVLTISAAFSLR